MRVVRKNVYYRCSGIILKESEKAVLFQMHFIQGVTIEPKTVEWWPKSQVENIQRAKDAESNDCFDANDWILEQKGYAKDMAKVTERPALTRNDNFDLPDPEPDELPRSERKSFKVNEFDPMNDDIPF